MLDIKWIIKNPKEADEAFKKRGLKPLSDKLIKMSKSRSQSFVQLESLLEQRNKFSKEIPSIKDKDKKEKLIEKVKSLKKETASFRGVYQNNETWFRDDESA